EGAKDQLARRRERPQQFDLEFVRLVDRQVVRHFQPPAAASIAATSIFFIFNIAWVARAARSLSGSPRSLASARGITCHETPKRSLSQPHWLSSPPSVSFCQ